MSARIAMLSDGAIARLGIRVELVPERFPVRYTGERPDEGLGLVHVVTSNSLQMVSCGPRQFHGFQLRLARGPVTCRQCAFWPETLGRVQGQSDEWIREKFALFRLPEVWSKPTEQVSGRGYDIDETFRSMARGGT